MIDILQIPIYDSAPRTIETAVKRTVTINQYSDIILSIKDNQYIDYKIRAYVFKNSGVKTILGTHFMCTNGIILDFKNHVVVFDNFEVDMPRNSATLTHDDPDILIIQKSKIYLTDYQRPPA